MQSLNQCWTLPYAFPFLFHPSFRDEFFHFVILCFSIGILLVSYYKYNNWTVSLGIGLMTFAALETTGIYFGLVRRIQRILESFIPMLQRARIPGNT
ncbi:Transmembrane protein 40 [Varanus komodoensis]|nr:Transmembrane protein 40 [Varanus komodoensis]